MFQFEFATIIDYFDGEGAWVTVFGIDAEECQMIERWNIYINREMVGW